MSEGTRIWKSGPRDSQAILEYDILSVLKCLNEETVRVNQSCVSFMEATDSDKILPKKLREYFDQDTQDKINLKCLFFIFRIELLKALDSLCPCLKFVCETVFVKGEEVTLPEALVRTMSYSDLCDKCQVHKTSGKLIVATGPNTLPLAENCSLMLIWKRNKPGHIMYLDVDVADLETDVLIYIDLLPVIEVVNPEERSHDLFLVPKCCKAEHPFCWKVSHCRLEVEMMQSTGQVHRNCYMVLKFILDNFLSELGGYKETPTTYIVKTAVLTHIKCCNRTDDLSLYRCTCDVLELLSEAYNLGVLPHVVTGYNLLGTMTGEGFTDVDVTWHRNRNRVLSRYWGFLGKAFIMKDDPSVTEVSVDEFGKILKLIRAIAEEYGRCWIESDCKVVMLPDDDMFLSILEKGGEVTERLVTTKEGDDSVSWEDIFNVSAPSFMRSAYYRMNMNNTKERERLDKLMLEGISEKTKQHLEKVGYWTRPGELGQAVSDSDETNEDETNPNTNDMDGSSLAENDHDETNSGQTLLRNNSDEEAYILYDRKLFV